MVSESLSQKQLAEYIPAEWRSVRLGDVCELLMGNSPSGDTYNEDGQGLALINGPAEYGPTYPRPFKWTTSPTRICNSDDVLICVRGNTTGRLNIADRPYCIGRGIAAIRGFQDSARTEYLYFFLQREARRILGIASGGGSTFPNINKPQLQALNILLPPLEEQRAIAHVLRTVQRGKMVTEKVIAAALQLKQSLMQHLFTYGTVPFNQTDRVELMEIEEGYVPAHWKVARLSEIAGKITKGSSPKWQGFDYSNDGAVFVRSQNIGWGTLIDLNEIAHLPMEFNLQHQSSVIKEGDILLNIVGASIGRVAVANRFVSEGNLNQAVAIVRINAGASDPEFVMGFLLTKPGQYQIHRQKKEIARANISLQDIRNFAVPISPMNEQSRIRSDMRTIDRKIAIEEKRLAALDELFYSLLHNLIAGQIRLPEYAAGSAK